MKIAIDENGERISADVAQKGHGYYCPLCGGKMILRQGEFYTHHFAHETGECVDTWNYEMSEWHYSMQECFDISQREVIVKHNGQIHRADILNGNKIIEFQHSPISFDEIIERNDFYQAAGYQIAWVFDVQEQYDSRNIVACDYDGALMYRWTNPKRCLQSLPLPNEYRKDIVLFLFTYTFIIYRPKTSILQPTYNWAQN